MVKDSSAAETGGWRFAAFDGKTEKLKEEVDPVTGCYNCHTAVKNRDYVFSVAESSTSSSAESSTTGYPDGYKDWTNTFGKVVQEEGPFHGFQRVLVSPEALDAYKNGSKGYENGDVLILEFNEIENEEDGPVKGEVNWIAVMVKDSSAAETGGWRFAAFDGKTEKLKEEVDPVAGCYNCHTAVKNRDYVFSGPK